MLVIAVASEVSMSSLTFPDVGVKVVVIGLVVANFVRPLNEVLRVLSAVLTVVVVTEVNGVVEVLNPVNQVLGVAPVKVAISRSVSGVMFIVPAAVATEW